MRNFSLALMRTRMFGGADCRFDWISQFLDFALLCGGIDNKSTRQIAKNTVPTVWKRRPRIMVARPRASGDPVSSFL